MWCLSRNKYDKCGKFHIICLIKVRPAQPIRSYPTIIFMKLGALFPSPEICNFHLWCLIKTYIPIIFNMEFFQWTQNFNRRDVQAGSWADAARHPCDQRWHLCGSFYLLSVWLVINRLSKRFNLLCYAWKWIALRPSGSPCLIPVGQAPQTKPGHNIWAGVNND